MPATPAESAPAAAAGTPRPAGPGTPGASPRGPRRLLAEAAGHRRLLAAAALVVLTAAAFAPIRHNGFISLDDPAYITDNPMVQRGLSWQGLGWAFTTFRAACWHPLTWLSHMLDVELFGLRPGPHHLHSLLLHIAATVLLFAALDRMTGDTAAAALAAALFAVHPLRVESVAWAAERKDVLGAAWWMLALLLYAHHAARPSRARLAAVAAALAAGLLAKPMLVTLPFALLLLDWWPLGRCRAWRPAAVWPLCREKLAMLALAAASSAVTVVAEKAGAALVDWQSLSWPQRLANAAVAYVRHLAHWVWPARLAVFYPLAPERLGWLEVSGAVALLVALTLACWRTRRSVPCLMVGWLWFAGTLAPVSGVVQIGSHALADRFAYVPSVGLSLAVVWGGLAMLRRRPRLRLAATMAALAAVLALATATHVRCRVWRSSESLYRQALAATEGNYVMHTNLGIELARQGDLQAALTHLDQALRLRPHFARAHNNRGNVLAAMGQRQEALAAYRDAVRLDGANALAWHNLGRALMLESRWDEAAACLERAVALDPSHAAARNNLGIALAATGQPQAAAEQFRQVVILAGAQSPAGQQARANLRLLEQDAAPLPPPAPPQPGTGRP